MNTEFISKMLEAKRLEAEALASLVPPEARRVACMTVRALSDAALGVLDAPDEHPKRQQSGPRPIVIE